MKQFQKRFTGPQLTSFHLMRRKPKFLPSVANVFPTESLMILLFLLMDRNLKTDVQCAKLLGLEIDRELTFQSHVDKLCKKLSQRIGILKKIRHCLEIKHRVLFSNAIIRPVMDYVSVIWSNCAKHCLDRVLKLQKRAARIIIGADSYASSVQLFF